MAGVSKHAADHKPIRILHISDTHGLHRQIEQVFPMPDADILIHTGDFTNKGTDAEVADFNDWMGELSKRYPHRVLIFGNHEYHYLKERIGDAESAAQALNPANAKQLVSNAMVLEHETVEILGLRIFGSAWCPWHVNAAPGDKIGNSGFQPKVRALWHASCNAKEEAPREHRFGEIPEGIDILLTHGPPYGIMDMMELGAGHWGGSKALHEHVMRARPRVHFFMRAFT